MTHLPSCIFSFIVILTCISCTQKAPIDPLSHLADNKVKQVLAKGLESAGGVNNYWSIDSISYKKRSVLYLPDGSIESDVNQLHKYKLQPEVSGTISWQDSTGNHQIIYSSKDAYQMLNQEKINDSGDAATKIFFSNYYVLFLPFKLMDPGATLFYEGVTTLENNVEADVIKATYNPDEYDNHSTSDEWYLYFDKADGRVLGNLVHHPPTFAFIENIRTTDQHPIRMNLYRKTWRTDKARSKEYLRGEFWYQDYNFTQVQ